MRKKIDLLLEIAVKGAIAGIIISMLYMLAVVGINVNLPTFGYYLAFGISVGFFIAFFTALTDMLCKHIFVLTPKYMIIIQIITTFIISTLTFFVLSFVNIKIFLGYYPKIEQILNASLWTGMASIVGAMVFKMFEEKEEKLRLEKENREIAVLEERSRIARELHDSVSQNLFGISLNLKTAEFLMDTELEKSHSIIEQLHGMVQEVQTEMRLMIYELRPMSLENKSFFDALENLIGLYRIRYNLKDLEYDLCGDEDIINNNIKIALYRVLQESFNNIVKHAGASRVDISLQIENESVRMIIKDDGKGFDIQREPSQGSFGISGMRERVEKLGGHISIISSINEGTTVDVNFKCKK